MPSRARAKAKPEDSIQVSDGSTPTVSLRAPTALTIHIGDGTLDLHEGDTRTFLTGGHPVLSSAPVDTDGAPEQDPIRIYTGNGGLTPEQYQNNITARDHTTGDGTTQG